MGLHLQFSDALHSKTFVSHPIPVLKTKCTFTPMENAMIYHRSASETVVPWLRTPSSQKYNGWPDGDTPIEERVETGTIVYRSTVRPKCF